MPQAKDIVQTLLNLTPLTDLPRTGWVLRGVSQPETVAAHSFGVAVCTSLIVDRLRANGVKVNGEKALRMALIHDAAEVELGDIPTPVKTPALRTAISEVEHIIAQRVLPPQLLLDWQHMEAKDSLEAAIVKAADRIQLMVQVLAYERQQRGHLDDFWAKKVKVTRPELSFVEQIHEHIISLRNTSHTSDPSPPPTSS